jgi:hypothetical protein
MVLDIYSLIMETICKDNLKMVIVMGKEFILEKMAVIMRGILRII